MSPGELRGNLDFVKEDLIVGWARDEGDPDRPVRVRILDNGLTIGEIVADLYREGRDRCRPPRLQLQRAGRIVGAVPPCDPGQAHA